MSMFVMVYMSINVLGVGCALVKKKTRFTITYISVERHSHVGDVVCHFRTGKNCYIIVRLHIQE